MEFLERRAAESVGDRIDLEINRIKKIDEKNDECKDAHMLVVQFLAHAGRVFEEMIIDIRQHETTEDRPHHEQDEICGVFEKIGTDEQLPIKNPRQRFDDNRNSCGGHDHLEEPLPIAFDFGFRSHDHIKHSKNDNGKNVDLKLHKIIHIFCSSHVFFAKSRGAIRLCISIILLQASFFVKVRGDGSRVRSALPHLDLWPNKRTVPI